MLRKELASPSMAHLMPPPTPNFWQTHQRLIITCGLVLTTLSALYSFFIYKPTYVSSASIIIKDSATRAKYLTDVNAISTSSLSTNPVLNAMELMKSDIVSKTLWNHFILPHPEEMERLQFKDYSSWKSYFDSGKFITQKNTPGTDVVTISFKWPNAKLAQIGLQDTLDALKEASRQLNQTEYYERYVYLSQQSDQVRDQLIAVRNDIRNYKTQNKIYNLDEDMANYARNRSTLELDIQKVSAESSNYNALLSSYEGSLGIPLKKAVTGTALGNDPTLAKLYDQYYAISEQYKAVSSRYTNKHPKVRELQGQLQQTEADILKQAQRSSLKSSDLPALNKSLPNVSVIADETRGNAVKQMLDAQAQSRGLQTKASQLRQYLTQLDAKMASLPSAEQALTQMKEKEQQLTVSLDALEQQRMDAKIRQSQIVSNVFIVNSPGLPDAPLKPGKTEFIAIGAFLGLALGITLAKGKEKLKTLQQQKPHPLQSLSYYPTDESSTPRTPEFAHQI